MNRLICIFIGHAWTFITNYDVWEIQQCERCNDQRAKLW